MGKSYTITGRSLSARLGADYASVINKNYAEPRYARQIADEALLNLDYQIRNWDAEDWLIPTHQIANQTPIAVISELAQTAGACLISDRTEAFFDVRPIWSVPAWGLNQATPKITVPSSLILSISGQRQIKEKANAVRVVGNEKGGLVYRELSNQIPEASTLSSPLYSADNVMRSAGIKALSETGTHKIETVTLPFAPKYQLPIAELTEIWAFVENGETWQGIVKGISLDVSIENQILVVKQTLTIDRYLED